MGTSEPTTTPKPVDQETGPRLGRSVSLDQAAQLLGVSRRTIYNRIRDGLLQTIRTHGGSQRVLVESCRILATAQDAGSASGPKKARKP